MKKDNTIEAFFALIRGGLWEKDVCLAQYSKINYEDIYRLAEEQSVFGLVAAGCEHVVDVKTPQEVTLQLVGQTLQLEQRNLAMNHFIEVIVDKMRQADIYTLLVKGQGIAQCYERPLWRNSGDIDFFLSEENYKKAKYYLVPLASKVDEENPISLHQGLTIESWLIELHGSLRSRLWNRIDRVIDEVQGEVFYSGAVRSWMDGNTRVFMPRADEDVIFVFTHILQHFFRGGVGLRQICDWCRLLWTHRETLNNKLLESRLKKMSIITEWEAFCALAANHLGMPVEALPCYVPSKTASKIGDKVLSLILETGNFGNNRDYSYYKKSFLIRKSISLWRHIWDNIRYFSMFPLDSIRVLIMMINMGIEDIIKQNKVA